MANKGLVLSPDLPLPNQPFGTFVASVTIQTPDGAEVAGEASFEFTHMKLKDGTSRWSVSVILKHISKDSVPIGSTVFVDESTVQRLR